MSKEYWGQVINEFQVCTVYDHLVGERIGIFLDWGVADIVHRLYACFKDKSILVKAVNGYSTNMEFRERDDFLPFHPKEIEEI